MARTRCATQADCLAEAGWRRLHPIWGTASSTAPIWCKSFENQNPANTLWGKQYNLYSKIDTEAPRYLGFERWWGGHVNLNAEEIQFIVDELFVGNKLSSGGIQTSDGTMIDLRSIRSPIVVFCSEGDNITPPQQALDWILDLYENADEIRAYGQTIVYSVHETVGHLGIFVSSGVARKEHGEFSSNIDLIDTLPPGLYEAVFHKADSDTANRDLVSGEWVMSARLRTLDDIRALGGNDVADDRRFATAARVSETNLALYRTFAQPIITNAGQCAGRRLAAADASAAPAIPDILGRQSFHGACCGSCRASSQQPQACRRRQSIPCASGSRITANRFHVRHLAGRQRDVGRADVPVDLRIAGAAGARVGVDPDSDCTAAAGGKKSAAQAAHPGQALPN